MCHKTYPDALKAGRTTVGWREKHNQHVERR